MTWSMQTAAITLEAASARGPVIGDQVYRLIARGAYALAAALRQQARCLGRQAGDAYERIIRVKGGLCDAGRSVLQVLEKAEGNLGSPVSDR